MSINLITGITGFVGSWLAQYIVENYPDNIIYGIKRWRSPIENIEHILNNVNLIDADLKDLPSLLSVLDAVQPDKIFHLAAQSYVPFSYKAPIETLMDNVIGTANLLETVRILKQDPLIHICGSSEEYGQVSKQFVPIKEDCPLNPVSPYGVSKVTEDMLGLQYYTAWGLKTVRTRMFTHTGPRRGEIFAESSFAKQIVMIERGIQDKIYVGNLDSIRTFADVRDAVRAYWMLNKSMAGEVYNIGGNITMTIRDMLNKLIDLSGMRLTSNQIIIDESRLRPADVTLQIPCCNKFKVATNWEPEIPFEKTLVDLLSFWRGKL